MSDPYLGEIRMLAFTYAPDGWALCQGQTLPVTQNQALFALLGITYGGNGSTNFVLPNLSGRSPVGTGTGVNLTPIALGDTGGQESVALGINQLPSHTHVATSSGGVSVTGPVAIPATVATSGGVATPTTSTVLGPVSEGGRAGSLYNTGAATTTLAPFNVTLQGNGPAVQVGLTGNGQPTALRNPYLGINFAIALQGIFPPRP